MTTRTASEACSFALLSLGILQTCQWGLKKFSLFLSSRSTHLFFLPVFCLSSVKPLWTDAGGGRKDHCLASRLALSLRSMWLGEIQKMLLSFHFFFCGHGILKTGVFKEQKPCLILSWWTGPDCLLSNLVWALGKLLNLSGLQLPH